MIVPCLFEVLDRSSRLDTNVDRLIAGLHDLKIRTTGVEENSAGVRWRIDRLEEHVDRIERRLELSDAPH